MPPVKSELVTLREYIEVRLAAMDTAVFKAEAAAEKRFEAVNEMRQMVTDAARQYMPRREFETAVGSLIEKVDFLKQIVLPRTEYDIEHKALAKKVEILEKESLPRAENETTRKGLIEKNEAVQRQLFDKIDSIQKILWIGVGIVLTVQFIVSALIIVWVERK
jgi:hypothetical protein